MLVTVHPGDVRARDLQSSNGTYLNGARLTDEQVLHEGDVITIGETEIVVRIEAPQVEDVAGATVRIEAARQECPVCGAEVPVHAEFCTSCGHRLGGPVAGATVAMPSSGFAPPPASEPAPASPFAGADAWAAPVAPPPGAMAGGPPPSPFAPPAVAKPDGELLPSLDDAVLHTPGSMAPLAPAPASPGLPPPPAAPPAAPMPPSTPMPPPAPGYTPPPMAPPARQTMAPPVAPMAGARPPIAAAPMAPMAAPAPADALGGLRPAGFWIRLLAVILDGIWMGALVFVAALPFGGMRSQTGALVGSIVSLLLGIVVPVLGWGLFGATPGKALLGLRVIGGRKRGGIGIGLALLRLCGMMVSGLVFGLGFLMVAFTRDKRALHDHLAKTAVVRK